MLQKDLLFTRLLTFSEASNGGASHLANGQLNEKLIVASVANSEYVNDVILNSRMTNSSMYTDFPRSEENSADPFEDPDAPIPTVVLAKPRMDFSLNGSDWDMNWICLFIFILALCFAIPLVYVIYVAELKIKHDHDLEVSQHHQSTHGL